MAPPAPPISWSTTAFAALFIGSFFAALPLYGLSTIDGPVDFRCRPSPWRCEVHRWIGLERHRSEVPADRIRVEQRVQRAARRTSTDHRIVFVHAQNGAVPVSGWGNDRPFEVVRALEAALRRDAPVQAHLGATAHSFVIGLVVLFFLCGAGIAVSTDLSAARAARARKPTETVTRRKGGRRRGSG